MDAPSSQRARIGRHPLRRRTQRRLTTWQRMVMRFVLSPLVRVIAFFESLVCTRWEIVPVEELPEAAARWNVPGLSRENVLATLEDRDGFLCHVCHAELETTRQTSEELFTDVWDVWKYGHCERCAADREHHSRLHHGHLSFLEGGRWMVILPRVPLLRLLWMSLRRRGGR